MPLNLKTDDDVTPVLDSDLVLDGDKGTTYFVRHLTKDKHREIVAQHTKKVPDKRTHQRVDKTDWDAVSDALLDYALTKWEGVQVAGVDVPCEMTFKKLLDAARATAILERAGMNEIAAAPERREESFRTTAEVR